MNKKAQNLGKALLGIALVIVIFSAGFYFSPKAGVSGNVVGITGMATQTSPISIDASGTSAEIGIMYTKDEGVKFKYWGLWYSAKGKLLSSLSDYNQNLVGYIKDSKSEDEFSKKWIEFVNNQAKLNGRNAEVTIGEDSQIVTSSKLLDEDNTRKKAKGDFTITEDTKTGGEKEVSKETTVSGEVSQTEKEAAAPLVQLPTLSPGTPAQANGEYTVDGKKYTLLKGEIVNPTTTQPVTPPGITPTGAPTTTTTYHVDPNTENRYGVTVDSKTGQTTYTPVTLNPAKDGYVTSGTAVTFSKDVADDINWNILPTNNIFTATDGKTTIKKDGDTYTYTDTTLGVPTKTITGTTTIGYTYKTEKDKENEIDSVTYTTSTGTLTVNGDVYSQIKDQPLLFTAAIDAGARSITEYDAATKSISVGGVTIKKGKDDNIYSYSGSGDNMNVVQYAADGGKTTYSSVKFDSAGGEVKLDESEEYTKTTTDATGKVTLYEKKEKIGEGKFETFTATYKDDNTIGVKVISGDTTTVNMEFTKEGNYFKSGDVYFDTSSGEFTYGSEHYDIYEKDGKYYYKGKDGKEQQITDLQEGATDALREAYDTKEVKEDKPTITQKNWQRRFATFEAIFTEFRGLSGFSQLFFSDEELDEWREDVDQLFAEYYLGTEYWVSDICAESVEREGEGTAYIETPTGLLEVAAHIEAERSEKLEYPNGTVEYLYKITYKVNNPEYEAEIRERPEMEFNVYLYGDRTMALYSQDIVVEEDDSFSRMGSSAIVQYSSYYYDRICIVFRDDIVVAGTREISEVCNSISEYGGEATEYAEAGVEVSAGGEGYGYGEEVDF